MKDCTYEIGVLGEMLSASNDYVKSVTKLNDKLDRSDERIKTIEEIGKFFIQERSNFSIVNKYALLIELEKKQEMLLKHV